MPSTTRWGSCLNTSSRSSRPRWRRSPAMGQKMTLWSSSLDGTTISLPTYLKSWKEMIKIIVKAKPFVLQRGTHPSNTLGGPELVSFLDSSLLGFISLIYICWKISSITSWQKSLLCAKGCVTIMKGKTTQTAPWFWIPCWVEQNHHGHTTLVKAMLEKLWGVLSYMDIMMELKPVEVQNLGWQILPYLRTAKSSHMVTRPGVLIEGSWRIAHLMWF